MLEILLVFSINGATPDISDKIYSSYDDCVNFVNTLVGDDVVNSDYAFRFIASDGVLFEGQCIEMKDWFLNKNNYKET